MGNSKVIHEYTEKRIELFWWIFYLVVLTVGSIIGVTFIVFPIYLLIQFGSPWLLILFTFIPLGVWIDIKLVYYTQKCFGIIIIFPLILCMRIKLKRNE